MFSTNEQLEKTASAVYEHAKDLDRGDTLAHDDIERISGCLRYEGQWGAIVMKVRKKILRERGIALRPIATVGYRFCTKEEQLKYCARNRQKRAVRQLNRGVREIAALEPNSLSLHQQRLRAVAMQDLIHERRMVKRGLRNQAQEIKKTETLPRPKIREVKAEEVATSK